MDNNHWIVAESQSFIKAAYTLMDRYKTDRYGTLTEPRLKREYLRSPYILELDNLGYLKIIKIDPNDQTRFKIIGRTTQYRPNSIGRLMDIYIDHLREPIEMDQRRKHYEQEIGK